MKTFRYRFTVPMLLCVFALLALSAGGFVWNVLNAIELGDLGTMRLISYILVCAISLFLFAMGIGLLCCSRYEIGNGKFATRFCFFRSQTPVKNVVQITHFKKSDKLVVYFSDGKYLCVVIHPKSYDDFCTALRMENPSVLVDDRADDDSEKPA